MTNSVPAGRRNRAGAGVLPPNPTQWDCEHNGLDLRRELNLSVEHPLVIADVFALLPNARIVPHGEIAIADLHADYLRGSGSRWSGFAIRLDDEMDLVVYNDSHHETRVRATLMEEFFHIRLGHPRSQIQLLADGSRTRTINSEIERVAYGSGAAALVPYCHLKKLVEARATQQQIGHTFGVSPTLVRFRMNVTKLRIRNP